MALDKKVSQLENQPIPGSSDLFKYGNDKNITYDQLKAAILAAGSSDTSVECESSATTNINLGSSSNYRGFTVDCVMTRGSKYRKEILQILSDGSDAFVLSSGYMTIPNDVEETLGVELTADTSSGQVRLNIIVDGTGAPIVKFTYKLTNLIV